VVARYVDGFEIWLPGLFLVPKRLINHMNSVHPNIKPSMTLQTDFQLPFLDVLFTHTPDNSMEMCC